MIIEGFTQWLREQVDREDEVGAFARAVARDHTFPDHFVSYRDLVEFLEAHDAPSARALVGAREAWQTWWLATYAHHLSQAAWEAARRLVELEGEDPSPAALHLEHLLIQLGVATEVDFCPPGACVTEEEENHEEQAG